MSEVGCQHQEELRRWVHCKACQSRTGRAGEAPIFGCRIYGECTPERLGGELASFQPCLGCPHKKLPPGWITVGEPESQPGPAPLPLAPAKPAAQSQPSQGWVVAHDGRPADHLQNTYQGASCVLLCGGPSLAAAPWGDLQQPGVTLAAVNNAAVMARCQLWFSVDRPQNFHPQILRDPGVMKFCKRNTSKGVIRVPAGEPGRWKETKQKVRHVPNIWFFEHLTQNPVQPGFLSAPGAIWGSCNQSDPTGHGRKSVMLVALRMLYWLGFRTINLLGCDFRMETQLSYAFGEAKNQPACDSNNRGYARLNEWFAWLDQHEFQPHGLQVWNCTLGGNLHAFRRRELGEAIREMTAPLHTGSSAKGLYVT